MACLMIIKRFIFDTFCDNIRNSVRAKHCLYAIKERLKESNEIDMGKLISSFRESNYDSVNSFGDSIFRKV